MMYYSQVDDCQQRHHRHLRQRIISSVRVHGATADRRIGVGGAVAAGGDPKMQTSLMVRCLSSRTVAIMVVLTVFLLLLPLALPPLPPPPAMIMMVPVMIMVVLIIMALSSPSKIPDIPYGGGPV